MSLYYEASKYIATGSEGNSESRDSLRTRVYGAAKDLKHGPAQVYALLTEATRWSSILSEVIENAKLLKLEHKLTPELSLLLVHDLLLNPRGIAAPAQHVLRKTVERHRARLHAEFSRLRIKAGFATVNAWHDTLKADSTQRADLDEAKESPSFRWARVNTLLADEESLLKELRSSGAVVRRDVHVPSLIQIPTSVDFVQLAAYKKSEIILQDKASCFPALLLNPGSDDGDFIDACAAPGNKTTHLGALLASARAHTQVHMSSSLSKSQTIHAIERDANRGQTLRKMVAKSGFNSDAARKAGVAVQCHVSQDFLKLDPNASQWSHVGAILLDPSCSGSGMIGRSGHTSEPEDTTSIEHTSTSTATLVLPRGPATQRRQTKRAPPKDQSTALEQAATHTATNTHSHDALSTRLHSLSNFQLACVKHAMSFPSCNRIAYSTCSIHVEENEDVVVRALASSVAEQNAWRVLRRDEQVRCLAEWPIRGAASSVSVTDCEVAGGVGAHGDVSEHCIRTRKGDEFGTMGFFVAGFVRDERARARAGVSSASTNGNAVAGHGSVQVEREREDEDEWVGISSDESER